MDNGKHVESAAAKTRAIPRVGDEREDDGARVVAADSAGSHAVSPGVQGTCARDTGRRKAVVVAAALIAALVVVLVFVSLTFGGGKASESGSDTAKGEQVAPGELAATDALVKEASGESAALSSGNAAGDGDSSASRVTATPSGSADNVVDLSSVAGEDDLLSASTSGGGSAAGNNASAGSTPDNNESGSESNSNASGDSDGLGGSNGGSGIMTEPDGSKWTGYY